MCQVFPLSSDRHTPGFFGSTGVGVGDAAGLALAVGVGVGLAPRPTIGSSPPVPVLVPTSICAYMTFGVDLDTSRPIRPNTPSGTPFPCSRVQVFPASLVFQIPDPGPPPLKPQDVRRR